MITENVTKYKQQADGSLVVTEVSTIEIPGPEDIIAEKEAQLITIYNEIQKLKDTE
jgi:hypothetical protein